MNVVVTFSIWMQKYTESDRKKILIYEDLEKKRLNTRNFAHL